MNVIIMGQLIILLKKKSELTVTFLLHHYCPKNTYCSHSSYWLIRPTLGFDLLRKCQQIVEDAGNGGISTEYVRRLTYTSDSLFANLVNGAVQFVPVAVAVITIYLLSCSHFWRLWRSQQRIGLVEWQQLQWPILISSVRSSFSIL